jgi:hypothetical protein
VRTSVFTVLCLALAGAALAGDATIPVITVEASFATAGPLSIFSAPDGSGRAFTEAHAPGGAVVDGTLTMILYADDGWTSGPVANFPREDIWLDSAGGALVACSRGSCPDDHTDANGETRWADPLEVGGFADPDRGHLVRIIVNGSVPDSGGPLPDLRLNSADLNGDLEVNLLDITVFAGDFYGAYDYRSDFVWDGLVNLSDLAALARVVGSSCP